MRSLRPALLALAFVLPACKSGQAASGDPQSVSSRTEPRNPNVITGDQIQEGISTGLGNAYDLVARLHPTWMRTTSSQGVQVWLDNQRYGGVATLRNVSLTAITSIRYMGPSEAQGMLGMDNQGGAIVVSTGR
jgi:hypothetical protein